MEWLTHLVLGNVNVVVHTKHSWMCDVRQTANILQIRLVVAVRRRIVDVRVIVKVVRLLVDDVFTVELCQDRFQSSTVPVISYSTSIITLTCQVLECLILHLCDVTA